jgi:phosphoribosylglycinamide formyltransferase 1
MNLAIFASGTGTNAARIIDYFRRSPLVKVTLIVCNKPGAGVLNIAQQEGVPTLLIEKETFLYGGGYVAELLGKKIDFIVLAGFLWKIPEALVKAYPGRIVNIHPALLPKYGGKGMYGRFVHEAVIAAGDPESGITIHYVDEHYDHGDPIRQVKVIVEPGDTPETLAQKIHLLEYEHFPKVLEAVIHDLQNHR